MNLVDLGIILVVGLGILIGWRNGLIGPLLAEVTFLLTFGLEILIVNLLNFFFKADTRSVMTPYSGTGFVLGPVRVPYIRLGALAVQIA